MQQEFDLPEISPEFSPLHSTLDGNQSLNKYAKDDKLFVKFYTKPVLHPRKSTDAGRAIYDEVDYIEIRTPGSQLTCIQAPVKEYLHRFRKQYERWKSDHKDHLSGTPLEAFPFLIPKIGLQAELKAMNIHTVEQLAELPDIYQQKIMGGIELSKRAKEWLNDTKGVDAQLTKLASENELLRNRLEALEKASQAIEVVEEKPKPAPTKRAVKKE